MKTVGIDDVVIGAKLAEPVYYNGVLLCTAGTPISISLQGALKKFGITEVSVNSIFTDKIDTSKLNFATLNKFTYFAIQRLDIDDIVLCAKSLVKGLLEERYDTLLNVFYGDDPFTYNHSLNVANLSVTAGIHLGLSVGELRTLATGSLLHDIGKACIDRKILDKPGNLTEEEYELIKHHPEFGFNMLGGSKVTNAVKQIVYQHHENWDGSGYPRNLFGLRSYKLARLVHIADVYEALCAKRQYKEAMPRRLVREVMMEKSNTMFEPILLKAFLECIPMYTVGEEINSLGRIGLICNNDNPEDPIVFSAGQVYKLSEFEVISKERETELRDAIATLLKEE